MLVPFALTILVSVAALGLALLLLRAVLRRPSLDAGTNQPEDFGPRATDKWIHAFRWALIASLVTLVGFHSYWVFWADESDPFVRATRFDARNRRHAESGLKGWVLDRSGRLESALIRYRVDGASITREYPLGRAAVHLTGYSDFVFGAGGIEYAYRDWLTTPVSLANRAFSPTPVGKDLKVTIDSGLQRDTYDLLASQGKPAAAVILLLPRNEVLAMASAPSFDPLEIRDASTWLRLSEQADRSPLISPLVNRAVGTMVSGGSAFYYRPGSTLKVFITAVALDSGNSSNRYTCRAEGFTPPGSGRPIRDFGGGVHGTLGLEDAFTVSCNQYFAQLGLALGRQRLSDYARRLNLATGPGEGGSRSTGLWRASNADAADFDRIFAPPISRLNLSADATAYDVALQSIGQGYADFTVLQMALLAAAVADEQGMLVGPTFDPDGERSVVGRFVGEAAAAQLRRMMRRVVERGTARSAFASVEGRIAAAGKTGTADRDVILYDDLGKPVVESVDDNGRPRFRYTGWTDSWFIGFAPAERPRIAFAVLVENGGGGSQVAAPLAARLVEKAAALGYLSDVTAGR